jgi:hypothetical protein
VVYEVYMLETHGNMGGNANRSTMGVEIYGNTFDYAGHQGAFMDVRGGKALIYDNAVINGTGPIKFQTREEYYDFLDSPTNNVISGQPQHVSDFYSWNNTKNGAKLTTGNPEVTATLNYGSSEGIVPREDVHFWGEKTNFNGTSGVGVGPLASRPSTCVPGVAYWATDEKKLYRCTAPGTWTLYYTPYTYPHPLRTLLGD